MPIRNGRRGKHLVRRLTCRRVRDHVGRGRLRHVQTCAGGDQRLLESMGTGTTKSGGARHPLCPCSVPSPSLSASPSLNATSYVLPRLYAPLPRMIRQVNVTAFRDRGQQESHFLKTV